MHTRGYKNTYGNSAITKILDFLTNLSTRGRINKSILKCFHNGTQQHTGSCYLSQKLKKAMTKKNYDKKLQSSMNETKKNNSQHDDKINEELLQTLASLIDSSTIPSKNSFLSSSLNISNADDSLQLELDVATTKIARSLEAFGVLPSSNQKVTETTKQVWQRTLPSSLLSIPKIPPLQALVPLSSLPPVHRNTYYYDKISDENKKDEESNDDDIVVEVPTSILLPVEYSNDNDERNNKIKSSSSTAHRPLAGNLSVKLTEYTRGQVGVRRPFRAGGMESDNESESDYDEEEKQRQLSEQIQRAKEAKKALDIGGLEAWKQGILLTAPPGVNFISGIGIKEIYGDEVEVDLKKNYQDFNEQSKQGIDNEMSNDQNILHLQPKNSINASYAQGMWDQSYFDDDSLFGSSSSSSDSNSDSEDDINENNENIVAEKDSNEDKKSRDTLDVTLANYTENLSSEKPEEDENYVEDIDAILNELTYPKGNARKRINKINPLLQKSSTIAKLSTRKSWAVTTPLNISNFHALIPNPAMTFPFELDDFQKQAVARLERKECVFLAAHTSAGKTVCAEYAIALARKHCTRAIYTSPIKALSNQKYRDFKLKFGEDVGLITGDLQIGADSSCLIMTTEILRSMLYRGADLIRDIEWVIFDEVHYINDSERGVVWEEVIIMLPDYVNLIFLSATTPNTIEFSDWIGRTKRKPVHVIRTNYRPVPLSHHLYAGNKLHKILEGQSTFMEKGHRDATKALMPSSAKDENNKKIQKGKQGQSQQQGTRNTSSKGSKHAAWQQQGNKQNWTSLVKFLDREGLTPTVIFSFSKKKCEEIANMLRSLDLNTASEKNAAHLFGQQTMNRLSANDASLPQVISTVEMVKRGIGVHHGGLLPILKEMVEILFSRNLIKVLFATETFAMGVNMPTRAVVFNSIRKHDGQQFRELEPGEYTQMAGRAGRRGLDKVGTVIICCFGEIPPPNPILKQMLTGSSTKLSSQFRLTYNMILNLLRVEDMSVEGMIKRSFSEFATQRALTTNEYPKLLARGTKTLEKLDAQYERDKAFRVGAHDLEDYFKASCELMNINAELLKYLLNSSSAGNGGGVLVPGRILVLTAARKYGYVRTPAIVLQSPTIALEGSADSSSISYDQSSRFKCSKPTICIVLLPEGHKLCNNNLESSKSTPVAGTLNYVGSAKERYYAIQEIELDQILMISNSKRKFDYKILFNDNTKSRSTSTSKRLSAVDNTFSLANAMNRKRTDPFAGFEPSGKKRSSTSADVSSKGAQKLVEELVIQFLIDSEDEVSKLKFPIANLREFTKGISQGTDAFQYRSTCDKMEDLTTYLQTLSSHCHPNINHYYAELEKRETLRSTVASLKHILSNESLRLFPDFLQRKALLRTLGYVDEHDTVCVKGRVACEVNTCEELIVTEMVFEGVLNDLEPPEIVAALSSLIFQEKNDNELDSELPDRLVSCCEDMRRIAMKLGQMQNDHGLLIDPLDYCDSSLKFGLVHVVYEWALGVPFSKICELTLVQEGSIVRCITRLDELCREVRNCARVVGNPTLYRNMEAASTSIKRDIVFASSLYIS